MGVPIRAELILSTKETGGGGAGKVLTSDKTSSVMEKYVKPVMSLLLVKLLGGTLFKGLLTGLSGILGGLFKGGAAATTGGIAGGAISGGVLGKGIWDGFKSAMKAGWKALAFMGGLIWLGLKTALKGAGKLLMGLGGLIWAGVKAASAFIGGGLAKAGAMMGTAFTNVLGVFAGVTFPALIAHKIVQSDWFNKIMGYDRLVSDDTDLNTPEGRKYYAAKQDLASRGEERSEKDVKAHLKGGFEVEGGWDKYLKGEGEKMEAGGTMSPEESKLWEPYLETMKETGAEKEKINEIMSVGLPLMMQESAELKTMYLTLLPVIGAKNAEAVARKMSTEAITKENNAYKEQVRLLSELRTKSKYTSSSSDARAGGSQRYGGGTSHRGRKEYGEADEQGRRSVSGYTSTSVSSGAYKHYLKSKYGSVVPDAVG